MACTCVGPAFDDWVVCSWGAGGIDIPEKQHSDLTSRLAVSQYGLHVNACLQTGLSYIGFQGPKL